MTKLWQHQKDALEYLNRGQNFGLLRHGVATGKTRTALTFMYEKRYRSILVVAPKNVIITGTWQKEVKANGLPFIVNEYIEGSVTLRARKLQEDLKKFQPSIYLMNYEAFSKEVMFKVLMNMQLDCVVFDEVHRLRGHSTRQSRMAYKLAFHHGVNTFRIGLTGTLFYDKPLDVFGIMRFIDTSVFGGNWTAFKNRYAIWRGQYNQIPFQYTNLWELKAKVQAVWHNVDRRDVLDLPSEQHVVLTGEFAPNEIAEYRHFNKEFVLAVNEYRQNPIAATNVLDMINKLQQMTGGFIYKDKRANHFSNAKANILKELLEDSDQNVIVFYKYKAEKTIIQNVALSAERRIYHISGEGSDYEYWMKDDTKSVLAVQISSGSEGIDLTKAAITIFYDLTYSYGQYEQALGRTSRTTQQSPNLLYYYLIIKNSIDEKIYKALNNKKDLIEELIS